MSAGENDLVEMLERVLRHAKEGRLAAFACAMTYTREEREGCWGYGATIADDWNRPGLLAALELAKKRVLEHVAME